MAAAFGLPASAQEPVVEIVYGPLENGHAGTIYADTNATIEVEVWFRTAPGISIWSMHLPLSSSDDYIVSRNGGTLFHPLTEWQVWTFLDPVEDPNNVGYTNQGFVGYYWVQPDYEMGIHTEGEWWQVMSYTMTTALDIELEVPYCDAFIEGFDPNNGGPVLVNFPAGELDRSEYTIEYPCLQFSNTCDFYIPGDFNGSGEFNVADIVESFSNLSTGAPEGGLICECPPGSGNGWAVAMDVNNNCVFNVADVVVAYQRLAFGQIEFVPSE